MSTLSLFPFPMLVVTDGGPVKKNFFGLFCHHPKNLTGFLLTEVWGTFLHFLEYYSIIVIQTKCPFIIDF